MLNAGFSAMLSENGEKAFNKAKYLHCPGSFNIMDFRTEMFMYIQVIRGGYHVYL